jgi:multifunctional methyltransferase subunit TRM112
LFVEKATADVEVEKEEQQQLQQQQPQGGEEDLSPSQTLKDLHSLLLETTIKEGKLVCGNCGHEYAIKEGIANFLLPSHLV